MAIVTRIPPEAWERAGGRAIATAFELLAEQAREAERERQRQQDGEPPRRGPRRVIDSG